MSIAIQDSLKVVKETVENSISSSESYINWWMWLTFAELGIIIFLLIKHHSQSRNNLKQQFKAESLNQEIDFNNIINSSFNSAALYNSLKVKCHPDRFPTDEEKNAIAETLFQEISKSKTNVKRLLELKEEAEQKLSINL